MPIPRKIQDEFFIPGINILHHEDTTNQAVIYQPYEPIHVQILEFGRNIENLEDFVSQINNIFDGITRINQINANPFLIIISFFQEMFLRDYLNRFLLSSTSDNITSLAYELYQDIQNNSDLQNRLGTINVNHLERSVHKYYKDLLGKKEKENQKRKKENFDIQFKEFKIHQNYTEKRKYKEIRNINVKKYQHYLRILTRKNRNKVFCNHFAFSYFLYDVNNVNGQYQNHIFEEQ